MFHVITLHNISLIWMTWHFMTKLGISWRDIWWHFITYNFMTFRDVTFTHSRQVHLVVDRIHLALKFGLYGVLIFCFQSIVLCTLADFHNVFFFFVTFLVTRIGFCLLFLFPALWTFYHNVSGARMSSRGIKSWLHQQRKSRVATHTNTAAHDGK